MNITDFEKEVCEAFLSEFEFAGHNKVYEYYGDEFYPFARNVTFLRQKDEKPASKKDCSKMKKIDKIIYENKIRILEESLNPKKNVFNFQHFTIPRIADSNTLELRAIVFMYFTKFILSKKEKYISDIPFVFSVIVSIQRFIKLIEAEHKQFSVICLRDLKEYCGKLISEFDFDGAALHQKAPMLIQSSDFDKYIPKTPVSLYSHQEEVAGLMSTSDFLKNGGINIYSTATNSGKTYTTVGIAKNVKNLKRFIPELQFIFCCAIESVRLKVAQLLKYSYISVGIAKKTKTSYVIDNTNFNRCAIVACPEVCYQLLLEEEMREKTVLFIDEMTMNAHDITSKDVYNYMRVFSVAPKWTIISNANLPSDDRIQFLIKYHQTTFPTAQLFTTSSNVIFSCSSVETFSKKYILPHMNCKTVSDLKIGVKNISENQFKGRMYNPTAIRKMYNNIVKCFGFFLADDEHNPNQEERQDICDWKSKLPNIDELFGDVTQLYADNIRKIAMDMLSVVIDFEMDDMVEILCRIPKAVCNDINLLNLALHEYQNVTLVAHPKPDEFAVNMFACNLEQVKTEIGSLYKLHSAYESKLEEWQKKYDKLDSMYKNETEKSRAKEDHLSVKPSLTFPEKFQINTKANLKQKSEKTRVPLNIDSINIQNMKNEDLILLLYMGVGVYSETTDSAYRDKVLELASMGKLEFIVTNVCYGMDYPIGCVFITKEFSESQSLNAIYQLMSRVGRGRMSYMGQVYIDDDCVSRILNPIDETNTIELDNMKKVLESLS